MAEQNRLSVAVLGAAGYVGGELLRLLRGHPSVGDLQAHSGSHAGEPWSKAHPSLAHVDCGDFVKPDYVAAAKSADVVFLALPHGKSQDVMSDLLSVDPKLIVDMGADFRIHDLGLYMRSYGGLRAPNHLKYLV